MKTILIVEDDQNLSRLYQAELASEGYRVLAADHGSAALEIARQEKPDLVVLDIRIPGMNGLEIMARLLKDHGRIPIILNTAYSCYQEEFMAWGADSYIIKSSNIDPLKDRIREILSARPTA